MLHFAVMVSALGLGCGREPLRPPGESGEDSPAPGLDLSDGSTGIGLGVGALMLRDAADRWRFGVDAGDAACPALSGGAWIGGCAAGNGARFAGQLQATGEPVSAWEAEDWAVEGAGDFQRIALDGRWTTEGDRSAAQRSELEGFLALRTGNSQDPRDLFMGDGVAGSLVFEGQWAEALDVHTLSASLDVVGRGPVEISLRLEQRPGACASGLPDAGGLTVISGDERSEYTIRGEAACAGCWAWVYDGEDRGEVCF